MCWPTMPNRISHCLMACKLAHLHLIHACLLQVRQLLDAAYTRAQNILASHEQDLHLLADTLLEKETMSGKQILDMLAEVGASVPARAAAAVRGPATSLSSERAS